MAVAMPAMELESGIMRDYRGNRNESRLIISSIAAAVAAAALLHQERRLEGRRESLVKTRMDDLQVPFIERSEVEQRNSSMQRYPSHQRWLLNPHYLWCLESSDGTIDARVHRCESLA